MRSPNLDYWEREQVTVPMIAKKYSVTKEYVKRCIARMRMFTGSDRIFDETDINYNPLTVNPFAFAYWRHYGEYILDGVHVPPYTDFGKWR